MYRSPLLAGDPATAGNRVGRCRLATNNEVRWSGMDIPGRGTMMADSHRPARLIRRARARIPCRLPRTKAGLAIAALGCGALAS